VRTYENVSENIALQMEKRGRKYALWQPGDDGRNEQKGGVRPTGKELFSLIVGSAGILVALGGGGLIN